MLKSLSKETQDNLSMAILDAGRYKAELEKSETLYSNWAEDALRHMKNAAIILDRLHNKLD